MEFANFDAAKACDLIDKKGGTTYKNTGTTLNGAAVDLSCGLSPDIGWTPPYAYVHKSAAEVKATAATDVGAGKVTVLLDGVAPPPPAEAPPPPVEAAPPPPAEGAAAVDDGGGALSLAWLGTLFAAVLSASALRPGPSGRRKEEDAAPDQDAA
jgi:hypothetical protein